VHVDWNLTANFATLIVITATAIAAIVQLSHLRNNNQLQALLAILRMPYEPALADAFYFTQGQLPQRMCDPAFRAQLASPTPPDRLIHKELLVCDYYERLASCIKFGLIDENLYFDNSSPERAWNVLEPVIAIYRRERGPQAYSNFEYLVVRSRAWDAKYPDGNYPKKAPRLRLTDPWLEEDLASAAASNAG
jgi:hypothetical protein